MSGLHPARETFITTPVELPPVMDDVVTFLVKNNLLVLPTAAALLARALPDTLALFVEDQASLYVYDPLDTASASDGHTILLDGTAPTARRYKLQGASATLAFISGAADVSVAMTNQGTPASFFAGVASRSVVRMNLTPYRRVRLHNLMTVTGASGSAYLMLRYVTAAFGYSTTLADYLQLGASEVQAPMFPTGFNSSAWITLAAGALTDCFLALCMVGGDGISDPALSQAWAEFSS